MYASTAFKQLAMFSSQNPNLIKRRGSQGATQVKKKRCLDFEDLFNLKQKLIGVNKKKSSMDVSQFNSITENPLDNLHFTTSPTKIKSK